MIKRQLDLCDTPSTYELDSQDILLLVTDYHCDSWEGAGDAYALRGII